ncbi:MAG: aerobic glycerol-3-phosphate dehydrogenase-like protein, partial [Ramlibacter sp.]|nr:aerobic glycerol-3-phosphate dehydrogenase-like protein [Ramlibacter sp.]
MNRQQLVSQLARPITYDVAIIGGGATGLGVALDAAARGFSVVLVESHDFAKGTSSRATKLVHGGVRYLA